jgi:hypothetical protein
MQFKTRDEALAQAGDIRVHYKGGVYRKLDVIPAPGALSAGDLVKVHAPGHEGLATVTDPAGRGEPLALYEHLYPHAHAYYLRPDAMFEGSLETGALRFPAARPPRAVGSE